jgi:hypothetical protein
MTTQGRDPRRTARSAITLGAGDGDDFTPEAPMYKYTGRPLACCAITGDDQAVNYAKPG